MLPRSRCTASDTCLTVTKTPTPTPTPERSTGRSYNGAAQRENRNRRTLQVTAALPTDDGEEEAFAAPPPAEPQPPRSSAVARLARMTPRMCRRTCGRCSRLEPCVIICPQSDVQWALAQRPPTIRYATPRPTLHRRADDRPEPRSIRQTSGRCDELPKSAGRTAQRSANLLEVLQTSACGDTP